MTEIFNRSREREQRRELRRRQTETEEILWEILRDRKLGGYKFKRQYSVERFIIDFYCSEVRFAVELDGSVHDEKSQKAYDEARQEYIEEFGIEFLRIWNNEVELDVEGVKRKILEAIENLKRPHPPAPSPW